jgi:hypothetical protein
MVRISPTTKHLRILVSAIGLETTILLMLTRSAPVSQGLHLKDHELVARARLHHLQSTFDEQQTFEEVGLKVGNSRWEEYRAELDAIYQQYFTRKASRLSINATRAIEGIRCRLHDTLTLSPCDHEYTFSRTIHTTSKTPDFPDQFASWESLNQEDGWSIQHYDNEGILVWMEEVFGREERAGVLDEYERLPNGVLRGLSLHETSLREADYFPVFCSGLL